VCTSLWSVIPLYAEDRLIQFNETYSVWLPKEVVEKLINSGQEIHFMDITEYPNVPPEAANRKLKAIPSYPTHQSIVNPLLNQLSEQQLRQNVVDLSSYTTRYYTSNTGVQAAEWIASEYELNSGGRNDIEVTLFYHSWAQPSVIARITGTSSPSEVVILGAHIDSTSSGSTAPGADDDATGTSTVMEVFRVLASTGFRPERTLEFHGYAGEEAGLLGSQAIANAYSNQGVDVVAMMQLDMTGFIRSGTAPRIGVITDFTNTQLTAFLRAVIEEYSTTQFVNTACGYACSDHASWYRAGYPSSIATESTIANSNPYIHTVNDVISHLSFAHALQISRATLGYVVELSYEE